MNRVCLVGRLTQNPELKYTNGNIAVTRFSVAVNRQFSNQQGQRETDFINVVVWRKQAENVCNYLNQGSQVSIEGRIQTGKYEKDGVTRYTFEVIADSVQFLESKAQAEARKQSMTSGNGNYNFEAAPASDETSPYDYQNANNGNSESVENGTNLENDPFAEYGDMVQIDENFLD